MDTDRNYARFYALLARLPGADKDELVYRFTGGRTTHLHLTTPDEYDAMCRRMEQLSGLDRQRETYLRERRRLRSSALHQLQLLGIDTADWDRVNAYCRDPRIAGVPFRELDCPGLEALTVKLRVIRRKKEKQNR